MELQTGHYYHLYNRTNNNELLFKEKENYLYFRNKFRQRFENLITVYAYCLMPTHFHFLVKVETEEINMLKKQIGRQLSSYTKAINNKYNRHGSLFQIHTKAKHITDTSYLLTLISYTHQNPLRAGLILKLEDWPFSSYPGLAGYRNGTLVNSKLIDTTFYSKKKFIEFSEKTIDTIKSKYWV